MSNKIQNAYASETKVLLAIDCVIFGFDGEFLKVLLIKRSFEPEKGKWSLVGGFLKVNEALEEAADRILYRYTGLDDIYMEQVHTFGAVERDPVQRTISTAYYALINIDQYKDHLSEQYSAQWFEVHELPELIFDHDQMIKNALEKLKLRASTKPVGFELLPKKFTMLQLQNLYERIWDRTLDKRNFINRIKQLDVLEKLEEKDMSSSKKGSFLYQFDENRYKGRSELSFALKL